MTDPAQPSRIVVASRLYEPEPSAATFRIAALARALADDHEVTVLTTRPPAGSVVPTADERITVSRARVLRDRSGAIRGYVQYASFDGPLFFRLLARRVDAVVAEAPPTTGLVSLVAARLRRARFVYYPGDVWTDGVIAMGASRPVIGLMRWMESLVLRRADAVLAVSPEVGERLERLGAHHDRVVEVGNGVDTEVFRPDVDPPEHERPYFVYTGTMSEWQRPEIFVEALARLGDSAAGVELRFFGQGTAEADVRDAAERLLPGRVHFGGVVSPADSARWIRGAVGALVSIVPGVGYDFARPTKTYAAAATGTPVLYAGAAAGAMVVAGARLGETADFTADAIAAAMQRLLEQHADGRADALRPERARWARDNVSLAAVGRRAADAVQSALTGARRAAR